MAATGIEVSVHTVRRTLHAEGFHARTPRRTPLLTQKAQGNLNKPQKFWNTILWSDETKLDLFGAMDQRYIGRKNNEAYVRKNTLPTVKHGGGLLTLCLPSPSILVKEKPPPVADNEYTRF